MPNFMLRPAAKHDTYGLDMGLQGKPSIAEIPHWPLANLALPENEHVGEFSGTIIVHGCTGDDDEGATLIVLDGEGMYVGQWHVFTTNRPLAQHCARHLLCVASHQPITAQWLAAHGWANVL